MSRMISFLSTVLLGVLVPAVSSAWTAASGAPAIAACQASGPSGEPYAGAPYFDWTGIMNADTAQNMSIDCGDSHTWDFESGTYDYVSWVAIYVWDRSTSEDVTCSMKVISRAGDVMYSGAMKGTSGSHMWNTRMLSWTVPFIGGDVYVGCSIPKASGASYSGVSSLHVFHEGH